MTVEPEGIKGGGKVGIGEEDMGDGMQCSDHPYRNNPGGICAFCLQEKLGKLVSSSFPLPIRASSSSSSSPPSFRSDFGVAGGGCGGAANGPASSSSLSLAAVHHHHHQAKSKNDNHDYYTRRARIPFLLAKKKKVTAAADRASASAAFKRSKSTSTPATRRGHFEEEEEEEEEDYNSPRKRGGFWSFLYLSSSSSSSKFSAVRKIDHEPSKDPKIASLQTTASGSRGGIVVGATEDDSPNSRATVASASSFERKVSRSRSVGCGSRSFSGDFFERISTGFGDCTLRRVESQREGKQKVTSSSMHSGGGGNMKERVKCGGIFGGFIMTSSSSSSSSSSYWVSTAEVDKSTLAHGRSRSWGWAFASPMRAFSKPSSSSSKDAKKDIIRQASDKNATPNLAAIPSLLTVRG